MIELHGNAHAFFYGRPPRVPRKPFGYPLSLPDPSPGLDAIRYLLFFRCFIERFLEGRLALVKAILLTGFAMESNRGRSRGRQPCTCNFVDRRQWSAALIFWEAFSPQDISTTKRVSHGFHLSGNASSSTGASKGIGAAARRRPFRGRGCESAIGPRPVAGAQLKAIAELSACVGLI